jgi:hypothetical protein
MEEDKYGVRSVEGVELIEGNLLVARGRNPRIMTLIENDVIKYKDEYYMVEWGEITIYADGKVDVSKGELIRTSPSPTAEILIDLEDSEWLELQ